MSPVDLVCLSENFDLRSMFADAFDAHAPGLRLLNPSEVSDPRTIRYALAHDPAADAFETFPGLDLICSWGAGVDRLLSHPGLPERVAIKRMIDPAQARMMAAFAAYYVTGWQRRMFDYPAQQQQRRWRQINATHPGAFPVGVLGYGRMGAAIAQGLAGLGFPVIAWAGRARRDGVVEVLAAQAGFDRVIAESAALINVLPLTPETRGILCAPVFAGMRDDAILIQLARGAHLVETDLLAALDAGRPAMAALDVMVEEPLPPDSPLGAHPRVMITPHVASGASPEGVARSVAAGIADFARGGTPEGLVDRRRGY